MDSSITTSSVKTWSDEIKIVCAHKAHSIEQFALYSYKSVEVIDLSKPMAYAGFVNFSDSV